MPRYFFSLVDGKHSAADKYGKELDSLYEAHLHALRMFEKLIQFIPDSLSPTCQIKITSATGEPVLTVFLPPWPVRSGSGKWSAHRGRRPAHCHVVWARGNGPSTIPAHSHLHASYPFRSWSLRHTARRQLLVRR